MKTIKLFMILFMLWAGNISHAQITVTNDDLWNTADEMFLANELFESGEPYAEALGYNLDDLDPMNPNSPDRLAYITGIENYEYSRYLLNTLNGRSGMGLHMMWSPLIMQMASMQPDSFDGQFTGGTANGFKEDDMLMMMIGNFGMNANFVPFEHPFPQFADFLEGDINLPQPVATDFTHNFASTRWNRSLMNKTLNLGAMGQSASKQYLWAQDMLSAFHDGNENEIVADGSVSPDLPDSPMFDPDNDIYYGGNNVDGFIGQVLTAESVNKTKLLITKLAYDGTSLGAVDPATYNPQNGIRYFPTKIAVMETGVAEGLPPKWDTFTVTDPMSKLFDQWSYLLATTSYMNMMDPNNDSDAAHLAYHEVFDGYPFPASMQETGTPGPYDLMKGASKVIFLNMMAMHFNTAEGTFVEGAMLNTSGMPVMDGEVSAENAGYVLVALKKFKEEFVGTPLETPATNAIVSQADYILTHLKDPAGGYYNGLTIGGNVDTGDKNITAQAGVIRGLYAAYQVTGNSNYLSEANAAYDYLIAHFYIADKHVFKTEENNGTATYNPTNLAMLSGALREARLVGNKTDSPTIYRDVFDEVYNKMILTEAEPTGETGGDSDGDGIPYIVGGTKPFVFAAEATYDTTVSVSESNTLFSDINLFPNPVNDIIHITGSLTRNANLQITISDMSGRLIKSVDAGHYTESGMNFDISVENLTGGVYLLEISAGDNTVLTKRFVKI